MLQFADLYKSLAFRANALQQKGRCTGKKQEQENTQYFQ